jgi:hypothetical protein
MCEGDTWRRLDADFDRIIGSLEVVTAPMPGEESDTSAAQAQAAGDGRAHAARGDGGVVLEFRPRKGPATEAAGQVVWEDWHQTVTKDVTRQTVPLRIRR